MKNGVGLWARALGALLVSATFAAQAFTLGDLRGAAVIGRALDVSVRVQGGEGEAVSASCVGADLFFADARQGAAVVTVSAGSDSQSAVRIQSTAVVNEPVVTVLVRATCGTSTMRRYVLLADFPQISPTALSAPVDVTLVLPKAATPSAGMAEAAPLLVLPQSAGPVVSATATAPAKDVHASRVVKPKKITTPAAEPSESVMSKAAAKPVRPAGKSVLKLDPMDILSDRMDSLDSAMLFAPTEDAIRHTQQITSLQNDVKTLRDLAAKNDAKLADLRTQLQLAQEQQLSVVMVYVLLALVLLCLGAVAWLWHKQRQAQKNAAAAWWHDGEDGSPSTILMSQAPTPPEPATAPKTSFTAKPAAKPVVKPAPAPVPETPRTESPLLPLALDSVLNDIDLDIDLDNFMMAEAAPVEAKVASAGKSALVAPIRQLNAETILDIRQQAEFFVSLGQTDRALRILNKQIEESVQPNPLVHLDLLGLYHSLGLKVDFRGQREVFGQLFNAQVPDFPAFNLEGKDLEAYPEVLADLALRWQGDQALVFLDACIFNDSSAQIRPLFDLAAFRDLLLLHALAEELASSPTSSSSALMAPETPVPAAVPVAATVQAEAIAPVAPVREVTPTIDLPPQPQPTAAPEPMLAPMHLVDASWHTGLNPAGMAESEQAFAEIFGNDLTLVPVPSAAASPESTALPVPPPLPEPAPLPVSAPLLELPLLPEPDSPPPITETPSRMLDLDFSSLALPAPAVDPSADDSEPIIKPPVKYATRSRWPVTKKPK